MQRVNDDKNGITIRLYLCIWFVGTCLHGPDPPMSTGISFSLVIDFIGAHHACTLSSLDGWRIDGTRKGSNYVPLGSRDKIEFLIMCSPWKLVRQRLIPFMLACEQCVDFAALWYRIREGHFCRRFDATVTFSLRQCIEDSLNLYLCSVHLPLRTNIYRLPSPLAATMQTNTSNSQQHTPGDSQQQQQPLMKTWRGKLQGPVVCLSSASSAVP